MLTEEPFLAAIAANFDDDAPRLIYADWLDEQGDCDRAEFIRIECALARMAKDDERRPEWEARQRDLLPGQQDNWQQRLSEFGVTEITLRRGLPEEVTIPAAAFVEHGGELLKRIPTRRVKIGYCQDVAALFACPHLSRLTSLDLNYNAIGDAGARALAASPHLSHLTSLILGDNDFGAAGALALAASPHLTNLTSLNLGYNAIGDAGARALAASPHLARLTSLDLENNYIGTAGAQALAASPHLTHLTRLDLAYNGIGPEGARALADPSSQLRNLTSLDLRHNGIGDAGARELVAPNNNLPALTELVLDGNRLGGAVMQEVARSLQRRRDCQERDAAAGR